MVHFLFLCWSLNAVTLQGDTEAIVHHLPHGILEQVPRAVGVVIASFKNRGGGRRGGRGKTSGGGAPPTCLDFFGGKCHHGSSCWFLHADHNTDGTSYGDLGRGGGRYGSRSGGGGGGGGGGQSSSGWANESSRGWMDGKYDHPRILYKLISKFTTYEKTHKTLCKDTIHLVNTKLII